MNCCVSGGSKSGSKSMLITVSCPLVHAGVLSGQTEDHWKHGNGHEASNTAVAARQSQAVGDGANRGEGGALSNSSHRGHSIRVAAQESETRCVSQL